MIPRLLADAALVLGSSFGVLTIVKVTAVFTVAFAVARRCRKGRAAVRHLIFAASFGVVTALPITAAVMPSFAIAVPVPAAGEVRDVEATTASALVVSPAFPPSRVSSSLPSAWLPYNLSPAALLGLGWMAGTVVFLMPMLAGFWQLRRLRRFGLPWREGRSLTETLAGEVGIRQRLQILRHEAISGPVTYGLVHPTIMLPIGAHEWNPDALRRALLHELEHVRRRDWLTHCLTRAVCALYWFHPLAWMAGCRLRLEAERACDDAVLRKEDAVDYAALLVHVAEHDVAQIHQPILAMARRGDLSARVAAVLDAHQMRGPVGRTWMVTALAFAVAVSVVTGPIAILAGDQVGAEPAFEVASVKPNRSGSTSSKTDDDPDGSFRATNVPLQRLIMLAYRMSPSRDAGRLVGGPGWIVSDRFDIAARAPENVAASAVWPMLRALLADRFKLRTHTEVRDRPVYAVVMAREDLGLGPQIRRSTLDCSKPDALGTSAGGVSSLNSMFDAARRSAPLIESTCGIRTLSDSRVTIMTGGGRTLAELAGHLDTNAGIDRPIVDRTELTGLFDYDLRFAKGGLRVAADGLDQPSVFTALEEQLGLKLSVARGPIEFLVIDRVEQPTPD